MRFRLLVQIVLVLSAGGCARTAVQDASADLARARPIAVHDKDTLYAFTVGFEPNQWKFPDGAEGEVFLQALEQVSRAGKAMVLVRGHADPMDVLEKFKRTGLDRKTLRPGPKEYEYILGDGTTFDLRDTRKVVELIKKDNNRELDDAVAYLQRLSERRAEAASRALIAYAAARGLPLDESRIRAIGLGMTEPIVAVPHANAPADFARNRRVEFRILRASPEALPAEDLEH